MSDDDFTFYTEPAEINRVFVGLGETPRGDRIAIGVDAHRGAPFASSTVVRASTTSTFRSMSW